MKHLKSYNESKKEFTLLDIIDILHEYIDEGYNIVIYSARGSAYFPKDIEAPNSFIDNFQLQRWNNDSKKSFKFRIDFKSSKDYKDLVSFLDEMNVAVGRFNDLGFYLQNVEVGQNKESDVYDSHSVQFSFES
jgi:hypothetical protein